jgi:hypothetical protein
MGAITKFNCINNKEKLENWRHDGVQARVLKA